MNRRGFLQRIGLAISAVSVGINLIPSRTYHKPAASYHSYEPPRTFAQYCQGYKGSEFLEVGYVYCPYIPLFITSS